MSGDEVLRSSCPLWENDISQSVSRLQLPEVVVCEVGGGAKLDMSENTTQSAATHSQHTLHTANGTTYVHMRLELHEMTAAFGKTMWRDT